MRKALIVGIDHYQELPPLAGCVRDAKAMYERLARNEDGTVNFADPRLVTGSRWEEPVDRKTLRNDIRSLFSDQAEVALLYFAGHGVVEHFAGRSDADGTRGVICPTDFRDEDDGLDLREVATWANDSPSQNRIVILDSCHSGVLGDTGQRRGQSEIAQGVTFLTASSASQYAAEMTDGGAGVFTTLLIDALDGAAANLAGKISPGSVYAHIDQSLGPWALQRPVFKTNVMSFVSLRSVAPPVAPSELSAITRLFPDPNTPLPLDPSYEPERSPEQQADSSVPAPDPANTADFLILQHLVRVNLVRPVGAPHMWHAAMHGQCCELTPLGKHYWRLVDRKLM